MTKNWITDYINNYVNKKVAKIYCCLGSIPITVPEYTDNAAALLGGLTIGMLYRTGDTLKIVH